LAQIISILSLFFYFSVTFQEENPLGEIPMDHAGPSEFIGSCRGCDYVIPAGTSLVDGSRLNLKPGSVICLSASIQYRELTFSNIVGTASKPITVRNCGGTVVIKAPDRPFIVKFNHSRHFRFTGRNPKSAYGIKLTESRINGLVLGEFTSDFQVDHIEISHVGFAGIIGKTDPTCDEATHRGNYTMRNVIIEHNYVHDTEGEGLYIGHTAYSGVQTPCGEALPHTIEHIRISDNLVRNSGWDGIQLSCATRGANIFRNTVVNYSVKRKRNQSGGITIGTGTSGVCHANIINTGYGAGIVVFGLADNYIFNNVIVEPDGPGIFCDERADVGRGYFFFNNTIINPKLEGIKLYSEIAPINVVVNNIIVNPGAVDHKGKTTPVTSLKTVPLDSGTNFFTADISRVGFVDAKRFNFRLSGSSPVINKGQDVSKYQPDGKEFDHDFYGSLRKQEGHYDIGAAEYQPSGLRHWLKNLFATSE
jgi:hypothetical protein